MSKEVPVTADGPAAAPGARRALVSRRRTRPWVWTVIWALVCGYLLLWTTVFLIGQAQLGVFGFDYEGTLWQAGRDLLDGLSPYPAPVRAAIDDGNPAVYPPAVMLLLLPLSVLPWWLALTVWTGLIVVSTLAALYLLGVRDLRIYVLTGTSMPVVLGVVYGNLTLVLLLGLALAWRYRHRAVTLGALVGALVVMKVFLWPLALWLVATRRYRAAAVAVGGAATAVLLSWAVIGFKGLSDYPDLLRELSDVYAAATQSLYALGVNIGLGDTGGTVLATAVGLTLLVATVVLARRSDGDRRSFTAAVLASIALSPIVWIYYFSLLVVPLALSRPRLTWAWVLVPAFWLVGLAPIDRPEKHCCPPPDRPEAVWRTLADDPWVVPMIGNAVLFGAFAVVTLRGRRRIDPA
jgi:hypothetical protein